MRRSLTIVVAVLLLGACSGDDDDSAAQGDDGDADEYVEATAAALRDDTEDLDFDLDRDQATCFATGLVDVVGVDALTEAGISPDEFAGADSFADLDVDVPADAGTRLAGSLVDCDLVAPLEAAMSGAFSDEFGVELSPDAAACLADRLDDQAVAEGWAATFLDGSTDQIQVLLGTTAGLCPEVATTILLASAPVMTPEAQACVSAFVEANPELVSAAFASAEGDSPQTQQLGVQLAAACPEAAGAG
jgi:hypothetical protein